MQIICDGNWNIIQTNNNSAFWIKWDPQGFKAEVGKVQPAKKILRPSNEQPLHKNFIIIYASIYVITKMVLNMSRLYSVTFFLVELPCMLNGQKRKTFKDCLLPDIDFTSTSTFFFHTSIKEYKIKSSSPYSIIDSIQSLLFFVKITSEEQKKRKHGNHTAWATNSLRILFWPQVTPRSRNQASESAFQLV